ncbi:YbaB/EbfC family nucleoid-associated protein [Corynebacterium hindlerae]|uniref:Nucleoid-associated protein HW450_06400 n=1 Tax=Corynebacterium hindlerae TaxID=699041 RepID=A0A7G5FI87_9CORY|nr:YbaB/EbfC family nucleoid-associated protein [Corynebacterium hindlerae]QMV86328.1 YbaB/EbfC family nucleoid-associated protein [Corynebacterium hindlerae]QTH60032.1 YbaB/EbfC family nucleoid-associated protein [Corynebacterium hindlerae]
MSQPDMSQIIAQAQQMQAKLQQAQSELIASSVVGEAGNGLVKITLLGSGEVTAVEIDPKVVDPEDVDTLQDLVLGAFQDAHNQIGQLAKEKMGPLSQGMPDMGSLFG